MVSKMLSAQLLAMLWDRRCGYGFGEKIRPPAGWDSAGGGDEATKHGMDPANGSSCGEEDLVPAQMGTKGPQDSPSGTPRLAEDSGDKATHVA